MLLNYALPNCVAHAASCGRVNPEYMLICVLQVGGGMLQPGPSPVGPLSLPPAAPLPGALLASHSAGSAGSWPSQGQGQGLGQLRGQAQALGLGQGQVEGQEQRSIGVRRSADLTRVLADGWAGIRPLEPAGAVVWWGCDFISSY